MTANFNKNSPSNEYQLSSMIHGASRRTERERSEASRSRRS